MKRIGVIFVAAAFVTLGFLKPVCAFAEDAPPKIKGLYVGMDINEVRSIMQPYFKDCSVQPKYGDYANTQVTGFIIGGTLYPVPGSFVAEAGLDKKVTSIRITKGLVEKMFQTQGISTEIFTQKFVEAYHIPKMEPFYRVDENGEPVSGWEYTSPAGVHIIIDSEGSLVIEKVASQKDMQFN